VRQRQRDRGGRARACIASRMSGAAKVSVLPLPVNATPIMSRPLSATGRPWIWMGVGARMPLSFRCFRKASGKRMSLKDSSGGGMLEPSQTMCSRSLISWWSARGPDSNGF